MDRDCIGLFSRNLAFILNGFPATLGQIKRSISEDDVYKMCCGAPRDEVVDKYHKLKVLYDKSREERKYRRAKYLKVLMDQVLHYVN